ncbi:MAG: hypothetical protein CVU89_07055 [Firmicutes bacterium HGW-Firmicutes-14]|nr:MAG: hypothetical protein CVU89_07055 [Firmicutes bacterium HGW-Firmicutes-14]
MAILHLLSQKKHKTSVSAKGRAPEVLKADICFCQKNHEEKITVYPRGRFKLKKPILANHPIKKYDQ